MRWHRNISDRYPFVSPGAKASRLKRRTGSPLKGLMKLTRIYSPFSGLTAFDSAGGFNPRRWATLLLSPQSSVLSPFMLVLLVLCAACGASAVPLVPTDVPTPTETFTPSPTRTPGRDSTPTPRPTQVAADGTSGATSTPLFGPTHAAQGESLTATRELNPNAPRIEFFTADVLSVAPGETFTLFWSTRNVSAATIYRLDRDGSRSQLWNVPADGSLAVSTRRSDRELVEFVLSVDADTGQIEEILSLPLSCPDAWFFESAPETCPQDAPLETRVIEQQFE